MRLRSQDDVDDDDDNDDAVSAGTASVGHHRRDGRLSADLDDGRPPSLPFADDPRPESVTFASASAADDAVVETTSSSSFGRRYKSRSETRLSDVLSNSGQRSATDLTSQCRLTLSKSTADWTALYERR